MIFSAGASPAAALGPGFKPSPILCRRMIYPVLSNISDRAPSTAATANRGLFEVFILNVSCPGVEAAARAAVSAIMVVFLPLCSTVPSIFFNAGTFFRVVCPF